MPDKAAKTPCTAHRAHRAEPLVEPRFHKQNPQGFENSVENYIQFYIILHKMAIING